MNLPNGHLLQNGKYRLAHVVGQGGFGITYKGVWFTEVKGSLGTVKTEVPICIKEYFFKDYCYRDNDSFAVKVHSETGKTLFNKFKEKLIKEAKILSEVHHPFIVNVLEVFEENSTAYIAMEYISGDSLKYRMEKEGMLPEAKLLKYVRQIGEALQFVHEKSVLHLDIKPSNILIDKNDNARLIDFGVSKRYDIEQQETSTTMLTLSKGFASIEQYDNEGTQSFSPCPDVYSLGATMYNLLTGKIPTESILRAARPLLKPTEINSVITPKTEAAIVKAMQIIPADRYQSVSEMLETLDLPPLEQPEMKNVLSGVPLPGEGEDTTLIYNSPKQQQFGEEDDQTIVNNPSQQTIVHKKKKGKGVLISFLITIFAVIGSAVAFFVHSNKPLEITEVVNSPSEESANILPETTMADTTDSTPINNNLAIVENEQTQEKTNTTTTPVEKPEVVMERPAIVNIEKTTEQPTKLSDVAIEEKYASLIASGKAKMAATDYSGAQNDFTEAKKVKMTEEVVRLSIKCDTEEEEKRIADRKNLYDEKMNFGKYKIVRKKSNSRYGAIDANANERIPCKYLSVGKANNGRAFEREDNLFDIYNADGVLVSKGLTYYD